MAGKNPFGGSGDQDLPLRENSVFVPKTIPEKSPAVPVNAAPVSKTGGNEKPVSLDKGKTTETAHEKKMTSDNYTDVYQQKQQAMRQEASRRTEEEKAAGEKKRQNDLSVRARHLGSQIDAWQRMLGQDSETDGRIRATIAALSRELSSMKRD
ncbi:MAG: hypothetical protein M3N08_01205 [Pseudomonadota bacterium]|nr:hypothetical protein [Pseudomonadota bacterium]